jgi:hypothetical protein
MVVPSFEYFKIRILDLPFDLAQGGESFDSAQDREPVERLVEPFRVSACDEPFGSEQFGLELTAERLRAELLSRVDLEFRAY